ncbi:MAG: ABC transporter, partial [Gammaproteobacteria bacterium]
NLSKRFGDTVAVKNINLQLGRGELLAILGPSGCGKSTLLRMIAGLSRPDGGSLRYGDTLWADDTSFIAPEERDCGMVFQDMALFPHLSIGGNIGFAISFGKKRSVVKEMLKLVNLEGMAKRMIYQLSGGQQQRVALARSLAPGPGLLLLDEPFSSLDLKLRQEMRREMRKILKQQGVTAIMVTHDQNEAFAFADTVAVMSEGCIEQQGSPQFIYQQPVTKGTASFVGDANFIEIDKAIALFPALAELPQEAVGSGYLLMCRPENFLLQEDGENAMVADMEFQGAWQELQLDMDGGISLNIHTDTARIWNRGERLMVLAGSGCIYSSDGILQGTFKMTNCGGVFFSSYFL